MKQVKYGAYLVLPLKYDEGSLNIKKLEALCPRKTIETMDINENVKAMLNGNGEMHVGSAYQVDRALLLQELSGGSSQSCQVISEGASFQFDLYDSYFYVFHTQVAFLCLGISFSSMEALYAICNPGYAENDSQFQWLDESGGTHSFQMGQWLEEFCGSFGLRKFFDGKASILLESYTYMLALVDERFKTLEELRQVTFNLHQMMPIDTPVEDDSEEDIRYVYAVKNQAMNSYRWGCCVASQTISYAVADPDMDFDAEMKTQAQDGMPMILLSLYEKYTCLRFTELISAVDSKRSKYLKRLKELMLRFRAFGTVTPANLSRWNNVRQIYAYLQEVSDTQTAIEDVSIKLSILAERQQEIERTRNETVLNLITIFGIVSILASVLSIIQILTSGNSLFWLATILCCASIAVVFAITLRIRK